MLNFRWYKCPFCDKIMPLNPRQPRAICQYCGMDFTINEAIDLGEPDIAQNDILKSDMARIEEICTQKIVELEEENTALKERIKKLEIEVQKAKNFMPNSSLDVNDEMINQSGNADNSASQIRIDMLLGTMAQNREEEKSKKGLFHKKNKQEKAFILPPHKKPSSTVDVGSKKATAFFKSALSSLIDNNDPSTAYRLLKFAANEGCDDAKVCMTYFNELKRGKITFDGDLSIMREYYYKLR